MIGAGNCFELSQGKPKPMQFLDFSNGVAFLTVLWTSSEGLTDTSCDFQRPKKKMLRVAENQNTSLLIFIQTCQGRTEHRHFLSS